MSSKDSGSWKTVIKELNAIEDCGAEEHRNITETWKQACWGANT